MSEKKKYFHKILKDSQFRLLTSTALGGGWDFVYALFLLGLAAYFRSYWFLTMGCYYLTICGMRAFALRLQGKTGDQQAEQKALKRNYRLIFFLAVIFSGTVCLTIMEGHNSSYNTIVAITMAVYTFYGVISAIVNLAHIKKDRTIQKILLRNCSMAAALGTLFGLERVLLGTFGEADSSSTLIMEALTGAGIFIVVILLGVNLRILASRRKSR